MSPPVVRGRLFIALLAGIGLFSSAGCGPAPKRQLISAGETPSSDDVEVDPNLDEDVEDTTDDEGPGELDEYEGPGETVAAVPPPAERPPHPLEQVSDAELEAMLLEDPSSVGPASLGKASAGALYGAVPMPEGEQWNIVNPRETWATQETASFIAHTILRVNEMFPNTPALNIGDISDKDGGHLRPHVSHQSGRDVDLGFYYTGDEAWYTAANNKNFDLPRNWAFVKVTVTETDVEAIFLDHSIQKVLKEYALSIGEDPEWLDSVFGGPLSSLRPIVLHEDGHKTHFHVRYYNPIAQETGRRIYPVLLKNKLIEPPTYYTKYKCRRGDTLQKIARKQRTTVKAFKKANRIRGTRIYAGRTYKIPRKGGVARLKAPISIPARRLPSTAASASTSTASTEAGNESTAAKATVAP